MLSEQNRGPSLQRLPVRGFVCVASLSLGGEAGRRERWAWREAARAMMHRCCARSVGQRGFGQADGLRKPVWYQGSVVHSVVENLPAKGFPRLVRCGEKISRVHTQMGRFETKNDMSLLWRTRGQSVPSTVPGAHVHSRPGPPDRAPGM